jgi:hypothetical protein
VNGPTRPSGFRSFTRVDHCATRGPVARSHCISFQAASLRNRRGSLGVAGSGDLREFVLTHHLPGASWTAGPIMTITAYGGLIGAAFVVLFSLWLSRRRVKGLSNPFRSEPRYARVSTQTPSQRE